MSPAKPSQMDTEVVVVGAGPTGLLLAGDLARWGIACTVVERRADQSNLTRAFAVHARTLEQLDARDLADELLSTGKIVPGLRIFSGIDIDLSRLATRFPFALVTPQANTERILKRRALDSGVTFVSGASVTGVRDLGDEVIVDANRHDGSAIRVRAAYAVGADGVHSTVRKALGLPFDGHSAVQSVMLADVRLTEAPDAVLTVDATAAGFAFIAPFGDGWYRIIAWDRHRQKPDTAPVVLDEVSDITRRVLGSDYGMHDARWLSRFHSDERQVDRYRKGRVFLAGDAAHVHSPAGGQGMNTGLQDAANLSWKLAIELRSESVSDIVLDTYHAERHPVGAQVLRSSSALLKLAMIESAPARAFRYTLGHAAQYVPPVMNGVARVISGLGVAYDSHIPGGGGRAEDTPLKSMPGEPARLYEALRNRRFVWVRPPHTAPLSVDHPLVLNVDAAADSGYALVRPDGYHAFTTARGVTPPSHDVRTALKYWVPMHDHERFQLG